MTREELVRRLAYDPDTGIFTWRVTTCRRMKAGDLAGCIDRSKGYHRISIDGKAYKAHRLAWLYVTGEWPPEGVDHIDGDRSNNAIANLRAATSSQNSCNRGKQRNNTSGFKGVTWDRSKGMWAAQITVAGKLKSLGRYDNVKDAAEAYRRAARGRHGEFANTGGQ